MVVRPALLALGAIALLSGCGSQGPDYGLRTPPPIVRAAPIPTPVAKDAKHNALRGQRQPTQKDAERLRPVLAGWGDALRRGDLDRATRYFAVPAIVAQSMPLQLQTRSQVRKFNDGLPCGAKLLGVRHDGRYVVGTFRLTMRAGHTCTTAGRRVRVAFLIRAPPLTEWR